MPVDPRELERSSGFMPEVILTDRPCVRCNYSLKGLPTNGACPECGLAIGGKGNRFKRINNNMSDAPLSYLRALNIGLTLMALSSIGGAVCFFLLPPVPRAVGIGVAGVIWWTGVFLVTCRRPIDENTLRDATLDSRGLRKINRAAQASWAAASLPMLFAAQTTGTVSTGAAWLAVVLLFAGLLSLIPVALYLSALADWAQHTDLAGRFRLAIWGVCVCGMLVLITAPGAGLSSLAGLLLLAVSLFILCMVLAQLLFLVSLFQLGMTVQWALRNATFAMGRVERLAERTSRGGEPERPCPECGYDLRGLHPLSRCPECGHLEMHAASAGIVAPPLPRSERSLAEAVDEIIPLEPERDGRGGPRVITRPDHITRKTPPPA